MGKQLTDVVETANASTSANSTFFPLVTTGSVRPAGTPRGGVGRNGRIPQDRGGRAGQNLLRHLPL